MKLTMLGTGNAVVTECYNTCFVLEDRNECFLVDGGGGNTLLRQLKHAGYDWMRMRHIFVTHKHTDHILGIVWIIRLICRAMRNGKYSGEAYIYSHKEVLDILRRIAADLLPPRETAFIDGKLHLTEIHDGESMKIIGHEITFFDIRSDKARQFGFCMELDGGEKLTCCGDEPIRVEEYAAGSKWLMHEAFCLHSQADIFDPYKKKHSTVKDACETAERLGVENLLLYHTEDRNLPERKRLYTEEGARYYHGKLWVPDDLEQLEL